MKKSIKLALRASEIRSDINKLDPGEDTLEKRRELLGQLDTVETEYRAALTEEAEVEAGSPDVHGVTPEERAFRQLESRAELRQAFRSVMDGKPLAGGRERATGASWSHRARSAVGSDRAATRGPHRGVCGRGIGGAG